MRRLLHALYLVSWTACHDGASSRGDPASLAVARPSAPPALAAPDGQKVVQKATGAGSQIYECARKMRAPSDSDAATIDPSEAAFEWTLKAPEADLLDAEGRVIGRHFAGPTWRWMDGSEVQGRLKARVDAPEPGAIAWLLLEAKSHAGKGVLTNVKSVQRIDTRGGQPPSGGCDAAHAGAESKVAYRAMYYFYE